MHSTFGMSGLDVSFAPIHSIFTWAIYALALPTVTIGGLYFAYIDKEYPKYMRLLKPAMYFPGFILLFFFSPLRFREYQLNSQLFWIIYTIYNFSFAIALNALVARGVGIDKKSAIKNQKNQKKQAALIRLPPLYYWLISIFIVHLLNILHLFDLAKALDIWQFNVIIMVICIAIIIISVFKDGFLGLKLVTQKSDWDSNMNSINTNADNAIHVLNTHTVNMRSSIYLLEIYNKQPSADNSEKISKRLEILSDSISYLENYFDRIKHQTQNVQLKDESWWKTADMLRDAETSVLSIYRCISTVINVTEDEELYCDRIHMTEVFVNIIKNAAEAIRENGTVVITGIHTKKQLKNRYQLLFKDSGDGIDSDKIKDIFKPHATTKNKDKNLGLGLAYCRNVITAHGGGIFVAESTRGKGTTMEIEFPSRRVRNTNERRTKELTRLTLKETEDLNG
jgi:signal transduction histidine kinase